MGCGRTLVLGDRSNEVFCSARGCPKPFAVTALLGEDAREQEHIVTVTNDEWVLRHPLHERIAPEGLERCAYNAVADMLAHMYENGRYHIKNGSEGAYLQIIK